MNRTDMEKLFDLDMFVNEEASLEEYVYKDRETKQLVGKCLVDEGHNGKFHGQKGHRKAYLNFNFDLEGKLTNITVHVPSIGQTFTFLE